MKTIKGRITLIAEIILIAAIVIVSVANVHYLGDRLLQKQKDVLQANTDTYAQQINSKFTKLAGVLESYATELSAIDYTDDTAVAELTNAVFASNDGMLDLFFAGQEDGRFIHADVRGYLPSGYDPRMRPWYLKALEKDELVTVDPYQDLVTDLMCTSICMPVKDGDKVIGVVGLDVSVSAISRVVSNISYSEGSYGFLVDSEGNIIWHPDSSKLPNSDTKVNVLDDLPEVGMIQHADVDVIEVENYVGDECYLAFSPISGPDWCLVTVIPTNHVISILNDAKIMAIIAGLILAVIAAVISFLLLKKELSAITPMVIAAKAISVGDFSADVNFREQKDEIGEMQNALRRVEINMESIIDEHRMILEEIARGNLMVQDMNDFPGEFDEISQSINNIKKNLRELITEIQFAAINLQSTAIGLTACIDKEEIQAVYMELSNEASDMLVKTNRFRTNVK